MSMRVPSGVRARRRAAVAALAAVIVAIVPAGPASAQNLVSNPNFTNGLLGYSGTSVSAQSFDGMTAAYIYAAGGDIQRYPLMTTPGVDYVFTFLAAAVSSQVSFTAYLGPTNAGYSSLFEPAGLSGIFTRYTVTGTASSNQTYALVQTDSPGGLYVTDFDVEPAPAPVTGGGMLSFIVLLGCLGVRRLQGLRLAKANH